MENTLNRCDRGAGMAQGWSSGESARLSPSPWDMPLQIAIYSILFFLFIKSAGIDSSLFR